jgi:hypothetical protein
VPSQGALTEGQKFYFQSPLKNGGITMGGLSRAETVALLCHESTQTTLRYAHHLAEAVRGYRQRNVNMIAGE